MKYLPERGYKRVIVVCFYTILIIIGIYLFFTYILELILPFVIAWGVALLIQPAISLINKKTRLPKKLLSTVFVILVLLLIGFVLFLIFNRLLYEIKKFISTLSDNSNLIDSYVQNSFDFFYDLIDRIPIINSLANNEYMSSIWENIDQIAIDIIKNTLAAISSKVPEFIAFIIYILPNVIFFTIILVMASFYICADFRKINQFIAVQFPKRVSDLFIDIKNQILITGFKYLRAYLLLIFITFVQLLIGFLLIDIEYAFTLAILIAVVDVLPIIGIGTILIPWSAILLIKGNYYIGFALLIIFFTISVIRQIIEPKIVGGYIGLYPLVTLVAMYIGFKTLGFIGMFVSPIILIILKNLNDTGKIHIWKNNKTE